MANSPFLCSTSFCVPIRLLDHFIIGTEKVAFVTAVPRLPGVPAFWIDLLFSPPTLVSQSLAHGQQPGKPEFSNSSRCLYVCDQVWITTGPQESWKPHPLFAPVSKHVT